MKKSKKFDTKQQGRYKKQMNQAIYSPKNRVLHSLNGQDALDYLQRITTGNFEKINEYAKEVFFLNSVGNIENQIWAILKNKNEIYFEWDKPKNPKEFESLENQILKFHFTEDLKLVPHSNFKNLWILNPKLEEIHRIKDHFLVFLHHEKELGTKYLSVWGSESMIYELIEDYLNQGFTMISEWEVEKKRIENLTPKFLNEWSGTLFANPIELGRESICGEGKGCFPGQEVIEKMITRNSCPRTLSLFYASSWILKPGDSILNSEGEKIGTCTSALPLPEGGAMILALIKRRSLNKKVCFHEKNLQFIASALEPLSDANPERRLNP